MPFHLSKNSIWSEYTILMSGTLWHVWPENIEWIPGKSKVKVVHLWVVICPLVTRKSMQFSKLVSYTNSANFALSRDIDVAFWRVSRQSRVGLTRRVVEYGSLPSSLYYFLTHCCHTMCCSEQTGCSWSKTCYSALMHQENPRFAYRCLGVLIAA